MLPLPRRGGGKFVIGYSFEPLREPWSMIRRSLLNLMTLLAIEKSFFNFVKTFHASHSKFVQISLSNFVETFSRTILQWSAPEAKESSGRGEPERGKQTFGASNEIPSAILRSVQNGCESSRPPEDGKSPEGCARGLGLLVLLGSPSRRRAQEFSHTAKISKTKTKPYSNQICTQSALSQTK